MSLLTIIAPQIPLSLNHHCHLHLYCDHHPPNLPFPKIPPIPPQLVQPSHTTATNATISQIQLPQLSLPPLLPPLYIQTIAFSVNVLSIVIITPHPISIDNMTTATYTFWLHHPCPSPIHMSGYTDLTLWLHSHHCCHLHHYPKSWDSDANSTIITTSFDHLVLFV